MTQYMNLNEFRTRGYLHELNRQFLHPLGLALEIVIDDEGNESIAGIWDHRDDPEGIAYDQVTPEKARQIAAIQSMRMPARMKKLGYWIQPAGETN
jgi:hypothetical protein